jgi:hypothetical protein
MRLRLFLRRLTVSAPRMAVRSALPWPLRWLALAIVFGFCAAIGLWAFEFGKDIAGIDVGVKQELQQTQAELVALRGAHAGLKEALDKAQLIANTADTLLTTQKMAQEKLVAQNKQLEAVNQSLRDDLGFFETLIPAPSVGGIAIRGLQAEIRNGHEIRWQVLVMQALKNAPEFNGRLELSFTGVQNGKPWQATLPGGAQAFKLKQYGRFEGVLALPAQTVLKGVSVKVLEGSVIKAVQSIKL